MDHLEACNVCGAKGKLFRCSRCKIARYCSKDHQVSDWQTHKNICNKPEQLKMIEEATHNLKTMLFEGGGTRTRSLCIPLHELSTCGIHKKDDFSTQEHSLNVFIFFLIKKTQKNLQKLEYVRKTQNRFAFGR